MTERMDVMKGMVFFLRPCKNIQYWNSLMDQCNEMHKKELYKLTPLDVVNFELKIK